MSDRTPKTPDVPREPAGSRDADLDVRAPWTSGPEDITPNNLDEWYMGPSFGLLPSKPELSSRGAGALLDGWLPREPLIGAGTRVIGVGSCFASYFLSWLADNGFNQGLESSPHNALIRYGSSFENPAVIAQQFRWAFEGLDAPALKWIDKERHLFEATEERRELVRRTLEQTDVLIVTLGLSEVWYDKQTGEPLWRALTRRHYDPQRHVFRVESLEGTKRSLEKIDSIRRRHLPRLKIVFTVSPVRLRATFRPVSAISANSASKAILRAALDEFLRESGVLNSELFYFPSYEIVHDFFRDPFEIDNRHVTAYVAAQVVRCFATHFCDRSVLEAALGKTPGDPAGERRRFAGGPGSEEAMPLRDEQGARIADLEAQVAELQRVCKERLEVIDGLNAAAEERLALIRRLDDECTSLRKVLGSGTAE